MPGPTEVFEFDPDEPAEVVALMRGMAATHAGWVNLTPAVDEVDQPPPPGVFGRIFGGRGPLVPLATWLPGPAAKQGGFEPTQLGIQHGYGRPARPRLTDLGLWPHPGWHFAVDNARRGLVVEVADGGHADEQLDWLITAALALTALEVPHNWRAAVYG